MQGFNVIYVMGYDAFGMPAENAAIQHNILPDKWTLTNIDTIRNQQKEMGFSYDWEREVVTCKEEYYKWNQWIFLKFYEKGLAYKKKAAVNWCSSCNTVLANEQVEDGKCWRCKSEVTEKFLEQWFFRITDYAEELLQDIEKLSHWPERVKTMQKLIGKSYGVLVNFKIKENMIYCRHSPQARIQFSELLLLCFLSSIQWLLIHKKGTKYVNDFVIETKRKAGLKDICNFRKMDCLSESMQ